MKEQIRSLKSLIVQLIDQNEDRQEEIEKQRQEIGGLRRGMEEMRKLPQQGSTAKTAKATYATVTATGVQSAQMSSTARSLGREGSTLSQRVHVEDDKCTITINTSRFKGEKADFVLVKAALQRGIDTIAILQGIKIKCLRPLPGERINIVFATEAEAKRAKERRAEGCKGLAESVRIVPGYAHSHEVRLIVTFAGQRQSIVAKQRRGISLQDRIEGNHFMVGLHAGTQGAIDKLSQHRRLVPCGHRSGTIDPSDAMFVIRGRQRSQSDSERVLPFYYRLVSMSNGQQPSLDDASSTCNRHGLHRYQCSPRNCELPEAC